MCTAIDSLSLCIEGFQNEIRIQKPDDRYFDKNTQAAITQQYYIQIHIRWVGLIKKFHVQARSVDAFIGRHIDFISFLQSFLIMIMSKSGGDESVHFCSRASHYPSLYCTKIVSCTGIPANSSLFRMAK
eukprot:scaffold8143_cov142-Skeletonema_marinoi.AAC.11